MFGYFKYGKLQTVLNCHLVKFDHLIFVKQILADIIFQYNVSENGTKFEIVQVKHEKKGKGYKYNGHINQSGEADKTALKKVLKMHLA